VSGRYRGQLEENSPRRERGREIRTERLSRVDDKIKMTDDFLTLVIGVLTPDT
jgi:hypothetical protein